MSRDREQPGAPSLTVVRVRVQRQELLLADGAYLVGRDASCHIQLDDGRASRRHARLTVAGGLLFVEDLDSMNGVLVNGVRVEGRRAVFDGDWIMIGGHEIEVTIGERSHRIGRAKTVADSTPVPPSSRMETDRRISEPPAENEPTQRTRSLEILSSIAEAALGGQRVNDAEDLLKTTLVDILHEAQSGLPIEAEGREFCLRYGIRLADATDKHQWLDYVLDLLKATATPCTDELASSVRLAIRRSGKADPVKVDAWAEVLLASADEQARKTALAAKDLAREARRRKD